MNKVIGEHYMALYGQKLSEKGFHIVPIVPPDAVGRSVEKGRGKMPGIFQNGAWRGMSGWRDAENDVESWRQFPPHGIGIRCNRGPSNILGIDADIYDKRVAHKIFLCAKKHFGPCPMRIGAPPKFLFVVRTEEPLDITGHIATDGYKLPSDQDGSKTHRVEIITGQFVAYGVHPGTLKPYTWPCKSLHEFSLSDLPVVTIEDLLSFLEECDQILLESGGEIVSSRTKMNGEGKSRKRPLEALRAEDPDECLLALKHIPNDGVGMSYDDWMIVAHAIKGAFGEGGLEYFHDFSEKSSKYELDETEKTWKSIKEENLRSGAGTIYKLAKDHGYKRTHPDPTQFFTPFVRRPENGLPLEFFSDIRIDKGMDFLVEGVLPKEGMTVVYGESGTGKTHFVLSLALAVALGMDWWERKTLKKPVLYIAAEGAGGLRGRVLATKKYFSLQDDMADFALIPAPIDMYASNGWQKVQACFGEVEERFEGLPGLVVIDTLARTISPGDENSAKDMGVFISNCEKLRNVYHGQMLIVHHAGKNDQRGARGHSSLRAAVDTEIKVEKGKASIVKQRDGEEGATFCWQLSDPIVIGQSKEGKSITHVVPLPVSARSTQAQKAFQVRRPKKGTHAANALEGLEKLIAQRRDSGETPKDRVSLSTWKTQEWLCEVDTEPRKVFSRVKKELINKRLIFIDGEMVGLIGPQYGGDLSAAACP